MPLPSGTRPVVDSVRPASLAPFIYANTYGNVYSMIFSLALFASCCGERSTYRFCRCWRVRWSIIPAAATLNRGMYIGLIVIVTWVRFPAPARRGVAHRCGNVGALVVAVVAWLSTPASKSLFSRLQESSSTARPCVELLGPSTSLLNRRSWDLVLLAPRRVVWLPRSAQGLDRHLLLQASAFSVHPCSSTAHVPHLAEARMYSFGILGGIMLATLVEQFYWHGPDGSRSSLRSRHLG